MKRIDKISTQKGVVLFISLILLFVLTLLGVTSMSSSSLENRMASNFQHSHLVFQAAETAIRDLMLLTDPDSTTNPAYSEDADPMVELLKLGSGAVVTTTHDMTSYSDTSSGITVTATSETEYTSSASCGGSSMGVGSGAVTCYEFEFRSTANISTSSSSQTHIQGVNRMAPGG